ncbi:hypothetical protein K3495_g5003 [Podosphaera aphanis]|nr:hypothetical protein K3495_g5003 [Podosphaera aphanis]
MEAGLQVDIKKCEFHVTEVKFLGIIITTEGIKMDPSKLEAIENRETHKTTKDIFRFIGVANYCRLSIHGLGSMVTPSTDLMKKDVAFSWGPHLNWVKPARLETDASDRGIGGVLLHLDPSGNLKSVAFFFRKLSPAEFTYEIYDKELLVIVQAFEEWRPGLEGSPIPVEVVTDYKALEYFMKSRLLSRRQARWSELLSRFNFVICYRPGNQNGTADALSRSTGTAVPSCKKFLEQQLLKPPNLSPGMGETNILASSMEDAKKLKDNSESQISLEINPTPEDVDYPLSFI